jgi:two-component system OmpR family response regulator
MTGALETTKGSILLIDDQETHRNIYASFLRYEGYRVTTAPDGVEGLDIFRKGYYDLVLCALEMPGMSGLEVAKALRGSSAGRGGKIPIILLVGRNSQVLPADLESNGIDMVVCKPLKLDQLSGLIKKTVGTKK